MKNCQVELANSGGRTKRAQPHEPITSQLHVAAPRAPHPNVKEKSLNRNEKLMPKIDRNQIIR